jgi:adenylosuccinate lyase
MAENLDRLRGLVHSQGVLLALTEAGLSREDAYARVQAAAMRVWDEGVPFRDALLADDAVSGALGADGVDSCLDPARHARHVDTIFARVFVD